MASIAERLPADVVDAIIACVYAQYLHPSASGKNKDLADNDRDPKCHLRSCAQVSQTWKEIAEPYLFRDITFSACSAKCREGFDIVLTADGLTGPLANDVSRGTSRCQALTSLYTFFAPRPTLCNFLKNLSLRYRSSRLHEIEHHKGFECVATGYIFPELDSGYEEFPVKPLPKHLFAIIRLFPNLRSLRFDNIVLDLAQSFGSEPPSVEIYAPRLDRLSIEYSSRLILPPPPHVEVVDTVLYETMQYLLQCFGEVGTLRIKRYEPGGRIAMQSPDVPDSSICENIQYSRDLPIRLAASSLVIELSRPPYTLFTSCLLVSPSGRCLRHLDVGSSVMAALQFVIDFVGQNLESLRFNSLQLIPSYSSPASSLDLRRCTNLRSLVMRLEGAHVSFERHADTIWDAISATLRTLPHSSYSAGTPSSRLETVKFQTYMVLKNPQIKANSNAGADRVLARQVLAVEDSLLDIVSQYGYNESGGFKPTRVVFSRHWCEAAAGGYQTRVQGIFPRLHERGILEFGTPNYDMDL